MKDEVFIKRKLKAKTILKALGFTALGFVALMATEMLPNFPTSAEYIQNFIRYIWTTLLTLLLLFIYSRKNKKSFKDYGIIKNKVLTHYLLGILWGVLSIGLTVYIATLTLGGKINININKFTFNAIIYTLLGTILQTFSEEVWIRSYIPVKLNEQFSKLSSAFIVGLIFASIHLVKPSFWGFMPLLNGTLLGMLLAIIFFDTKSIWIISGWHCGWNFIGMLISDFNSLAITINGQSISLPDFECSYATTIVILICLLIWLQVKKRKKCIVTA